MELESTRAFVKVVQQSSFSKAGSILKHPTSTISRMVRRLEMEIGTKLLHRTTRKITLTPAGRDLYEKVASHIEALEEARRSVEGVDQSFTGHIKLTATEDLGASVVTPIVGRIMATYPDLTFDLYFTNEVVDLVQGGYDLALRIGNLNPSRFKSIRLGELSLVAVASPDYLKVKNKVKHPKDLSAHRCLVFGRAAETTKWTFASEKERIRIPIRPYASANQMQSLVTLATAHAGVALVPEFTCQKELEAKALIKVLPDWKIASYQVHLVSPNISGLPTRLKLVTDEIARSAKMMIADR